jgi:ketosteroid isomerase-like protein
MSQENVELARRAWNLWSRGDLDGLLSLCDEDCVFDTTHMRDWPEREYKGHVGFRRFLSEWLDVWDEFEVGFDELIPAADGRVVSLFWQRGKGRQSGLLMDVAWAMVTTVRDGRFFWIAVYDDRAAALEAAGLSGQDARAES